jgi:lipoprotein-anchoring transpeptidase ErfK/SrfK
VEAADVVVTHNDYRVRVDLTAHRLTVTRGDTPVLSVPAGVGVADTPTPGGVHYIKELLQSPDPGGPYGPYAYGLSGYSENPELADFAGGSGVIGIHGTNDPGSLGTDVSHGCIRVHNDVITEMAGLLPLGTPVEITG